MTTQTLTNYLLVLALILATIFTVSWGVQRYLVKVTESQQSSIQPGKRVKFSL